MSWKADKFQALRDRDQTKGITRGPNKYEAQAIVDEVTRALLPAPTPADWRASLMENMAAAGKRFGGSFTAAASNQSGRSVLASMQQIKSALDARLYEELQQAIAVERVTRELLGTDAATEQIYRPMRYSHGIDFAARRDVTVVAVASA